MEIDLPHNWEPRPYQVPLWRALMGGTRRALAIWHRRAGKDLFSINFTAVQMCERVGTYWHMLPTYNQGRKIVWDGFTKAGRPFLDHFPKELIQSKNNTDMRIQFKNGSIYQIVGTDDPDRLVGTNPIGVVFSEYSLHDPKCWDLVRPILAENGGWAMFIFTPRGHNHAYTLYNMACDNPKWYVSLEKAGDQGTRDWDDQSVISDAAIDDERKAGMDPALIDQEFYCSFEAPIVGSYYGPQIDRASKEGRITSVPYDPRLLVNTAWDLGIGDSTAIWMYQVAGIEIRLIDYYETSGEGLPHYARVLKDRGYVYGNHYAPHDIEVRELGTGRSRLEVARQLGIRFRVIPRHAPEDGIEVARGILPKCWFDRKACERGIEALKTFRKEYDEDNKVYKDRPLHDWSSHGADAFRYLAMGLRDKRKSETRQESASSDAPII